MACAASEPWSATHPAVAARVREQGVLTVHLHVPLFHEDQVACGGMRARAPANLAHNLHWGAVFGHDRFLSRTASAWRRIGAVEGAGIHLARTAFGRSFAGAPFGCAEPWKQAAARARHRRGRRHEGSCGLRFPARERSTRRAKTLRKARSGRTCVRDGHEPATSRAVRGRRRPLPTTSNGAIETDFGGGAARDSPALDAPITSATALGRARLPDDIGRRRAAPPEGRWISDQRVEVHDGMMP